MSQGNRVREIRKSLNLTLEKFGKKIGMKKNSISQIENGKNALTEQTIKSICREYNVDYVWLTTGEGDDMFIENDDGIMESIDRIMFGENEFHKNLFKTLVQLKNDDLIALERILDMYIEVKKEQN